MLFLIIELCERGDDLMDSIPTKCPKCGKEYPHEVKLSGTLDEQKSGFNTGKDVLKDMLLGPIGIAIASLFKKKKPYKCTSCGYTAEK